MSGFVGFKTLVTTLDAGHKVRAVVRKSSQIEAIKRTMGTQLHNNVEFAVVVDMVAEHAFDHFHRWKELCSYSTLLRQ